MMLLIYEGILTVTLLKHKLVDHFRRQGREVEMVWETNSRP